MGKNDFDNLVKIIKGELTTSGTSVISVELPLNLPRGYIFKIFKVVFQIAEIVGQGAGDNTLEIALVRDPDDITTTSVPNLEFVHDVICDYFDVLNDTNAPHHLKSNVTQDFPEHVDVITARNLRANCKLRNATPFTGSKCDVVVYGTLERVTDNQILELLDIL